MHDSTQDALIDIAMNDPDWNVRICAVRKITNENVLKDIFRNDSIVMVRINAMREIRDVDFLYDECLNNPQGHIRMAILSHIIDGNIIEGDRLNSLLLHLTLNDPDDMVSQVACENLSERHQDVFADISKSNRDVKLRLEAISKITDENVLKDLAVNDGNRFIRLEAIQNPNLVDVNVLADIIKGDEIEFNRISAILKIPDCESLLEIILDESLYPRLAEIADNITLSLEDDFFSILNEDDIYECIVAVNFIKNCDVLESIVLNCGNDGLVAEAIKNTNFKNQMILKDLIKNTDNPKVISEAISKIDDELILIDYVNEHMSANELTFKAISKITDFEYLSKLYDSEIPQIQFHTAKRMILLKYNLLFIALDNPDRKIRLESIRMMSDKYMLAKIAGESEDVEITMAALDNIIPDRLIEPYLQHRSPVTGSLDDIVFKSHLGNLATQNEDIRIRKLAISKLNEKEMLDKIISTDENMEIVDAAEKRLDSLWQYIKRIEDEKLLKVIGQNGDDDIKSAVATQIEDLKTWRNRIAEINDIDDVNRLKEIANNDYNYFVRCEAEGKLENLLFDMRLDEVGLAENQEILGKIAGDETYPPEIRNMAVSRLVK